MNTFTIARKELSSYFRSPIAYGVMCFFARIAPSVTSYCVLRTRRRDGKGLDNCDP